MSDNDILLPHALTFFSTTGRNHLHRLSQFVKWLDEQNYKWHEIDQAMIEAYVAYLEHKLLAPSTIYAHISTIRARYEELARTGVRNPLAQNPLGRWAGQIDPLFMAKIPGIGTPIQSPLQHPTSKRQLDKDGNQALLGLPFHPPQINWLQVTLRMGDKIKQQPEPERKRLTVEQANALLGSPGVDTLQGVRDTALVALMLCTGIRESEVRELDVSDLYQTTDEGLPALHVPDKNGCVERLIPFGDMLWAREDVQRWLAAAGIADGPLFRGFYKGGLSVRNSRISLRSIGLILGNYPLVTDEGPLKVTSLMLRRTYARLLYKHGVGINTIQQYLGLASSAAAMDYIGLDDDEPSDRPPSLYSGL